MNCERLRHLLSSVYARATRSGSRLFHASSAARIFCAAVSGVNGGTGGRCAITSIPSVVPNGKTVARAAAPCGPWATVQAGGHPPSAMGAVSQRNAFFL